LTIAASGFMTKFRPALLLLLLLLLLQQLVEFVLRVNSSTHISASLQKETINYISHITRHT
jgi:hypothetical protein